MTITTQATTVITATSHPELFASMTLDDEAPCELWIRGNLDALTSTQPSITITGARACTAYGAHVTAEITADLAATHRIITGGAYGIEAAATSTAHSRTPTVVVLASGIDRAYPGGHADLFDRVINAGGALISEVEPHMLPTRERFQRRQRLLAALSTGSVIVEAGPRSGALQVAHWGSRLDRPVAGIPGPITSAASAGVHRLISDGTARLATSAAAIRALLP